MKARQQALNLLHSLKILIMEKKPSNITNCVEVKGPLGPRLQVGGLSGWVWALRAA